MEVGLQDYMSGDEEEKGDGCKDRGGRWKEECRRGMGNRRSVRGMEKGRGKMKEKKTGQEVRNEVNMELDSY